LQELDRDARGIARPRIAGTICPWTAAPATFVNPAVQPFLLKRRAN
jgi:hypothetical protein